MGAMTLNVRVTGDLGAHVADNVGEYGRFENVSEYVRDLIRHDLERVEEERFQALKAELKRAFAVPDSEFHDWDPDAFRERMRQRHG